MTRLRGSRGRYPYHRAEHLRVYVALEDMFYGDETGTGGGTSAFVVIAGYVGSPRQWTRFDAEWTAALNGEGITAFHSKEFFPAAKRQSRKNPYREWDDAHLSAFLGKLLKVIDERLIVPAGAAVHIDDFNKQPLPFRQFLTGAPLRARYTRESDGAEDVSLGLLGTGAPIRPPYLSAFVLMLRDAVRQARPSATVNFVLDENDDNEFLARKVIQRIHSRQDSEERNRIGTLTYAVDECHPGLQAADLYCYLWNRILSQQRVTQLTEEARRILFKKRDDIPAIYGAGFEKLQTAQRRWLAEWLQGQGQEGL